ncbi:MAG TPA: hypothetical protein VHM26_11250 [Chitinophagaceae bacterium]|jgi:hypothetical protein|nr:hypothetical protein [Chitinophagaceae bacterium]
MIKTLRLLHILSYLLITGQLMYYFFVMGDALKMSGIGNFVEQRKIVDPLVQQRHIPVYYACLALSVLVLIVLVKNWNPVLFFTALIALLCLGADILIALRENAPINSFINKHHIGEEGIDWEGMRSRWIMLIKIRGAISMAGFISLLIGLIWESK